jgi:hypothetical protein
MKKINIKKEKYLPCMLVARVQATTYALHQTSITLLVVDTMVCW